MNNQNFQLEVMTTEQVQREIRVCEGAHMQQAVYSTFHDGLTQVCFGCNKIRTSVIRRALTKDGE